MKQSITFLFLILMQVSAFGVELYSKGGFFIDGYDPVSYITQNKAMKGKPSISTEHEGAKILFHSQENLELFKENPEKFIPAYQGWCAYAMAYKGVLYKVDPTSFKVIGGKTYLFYKGWGPFGKTLNSWNDTKDASGQTDDKGQIEKANQNWKKLLAKENV